MVGRGLGLVMAFSFCFAPSHAVRSAHARPPQGAQMIRKTGLPFVGWTGIAGSELRRILKGILGRRRHKVAIDPGGVKSLKDARHQALTHAYKRGNTGCGGRFRSPYLFGRLERSSAANQALAFSTARSDRS